MQPQQQQQHRGQGGRGGRGGTRGQGVHGGRGPKTNAAPAGRPPFYCHTCGVPVDPIKQHYSLNCTSPGPNHEWLATLANKMGGTPA
jgi:hypothetical protein